MKGAKEEGGRQMADGIPIELWVDPAVSRAGPKGSGEFLYVDIGSIDRASKRIINATALPISKAPSRAKQILKANDVLVSMTRPNLNAVAIVPTHLNGAIGSTGFHVLRSKHADPKFLFYAVQTQNFIEALCLKVQGALYPAVRPTDISAFCLPPFALGYQRNVVARIETLFSELDAGEASLRQARRQLGVYRQSLLKQAFEGKLTATWRQQNPDQLEAPDQLLARIQSERQARYEDQVEEWEAEVKKWQKSGNEGKKPSKPRKPNFPTQIGKSELSSLVSLPKGWNWMTLESLSSPDPRSIQSGPFGSSLKHSEFSEQGVLVIGIDNVREGSFSMGSQNRIPTAKYKTLKKYTAREGDFLITIMATVGRCCRVPDGLETAIITKHVYRVTPNIQLIVSDYLVSAALGCPTIVQQIDKDKFGQTRPGLNGAFIKALPVPLCSLPEQQEIVRLLDEQFTVIEQNEREIDAALKRSEALRQSILKKAFSGQLVPPACRRAGKTPLTLPKPTTSKWWVYVLECKGGSFYKGFTNDLPTRWARHQAGTACRYTKQHPPLHVFYWEEHSSEAAAVSREKFLKSGAGREWFKAEVVGKPEQWEPASELLARISGERAATTAQPLKKKIRRLS